MKKILLSLVLIAVLGAAWATKPSDKQCMEEAVAKVWGSKTPRKHVFPEYYEQFMDLNAPNVRIDDWFFVKRVRYMIKGEPRLVGWGMFRRVVSW